MARYDKAVKDYDALLNLNAARQAAQAGNRSRPPHSLAWRCPKPSSSCPATAVVRPTAGRRLGWSDPSATHRLGLVVSAGSADRYELPVEVELLAGRVGLEAGPGLCAAAGKRTAADLSQVDSDSTSPGRRLVALLPELPPGRKRTSMSTSVEQYRNHSPRPFQLGKLRGTGVDRERSTSSAAWPRRQPCVSLGSQSAGEPRPDRAGRNRLGRLLRYRIPSQRTLSPHPPGPRSGPGSLSMPRCGGPRKDDQPLRGHELDRSDAE